jgi:hypothetical protein
MDGSFVRSARELRLATPSPSRANEPAQPAYVAREGRVWSVALGMAVECPQAERRRLIERALDRRCDSARNRWDTCGRHLNRRMTARYLHDLLELRRAVREITQ